MRSGALGGLDLGAESDRPAGGRSEGNVISRKSPIAAVVLPYHPIGRIVRKQCAAWGGLVSITEIVRMRGFVHDC